MFLESAVIEADKGWKGGLTFVVQGGGKKDLQIQVRAEVASITDEAGKQLARSGRNWVVADGGRYVLALRNLATSAPVRVELLSVPADRTKIASLHSAEARVEAHQSK